MPGRAKKLLLVDGSNLLCKAFFGIPPKLLPDGKPIHGVIGFVSILVKIVNATHSSHLLVVFDVEEKPSRAEIYPPYKDNRKQTEIPFIENPWSQWDGIIQALDGLSVKWVAQPGYEADDVIASYASYSHCRVVIAAADTDFLQLVSKRVTMFRYGGKQSVLFTESSVRKRYGIPPERFLEYKALIGDKTDNIDGIRGIGPKNAIKVLNGERELSPQEQDIFERNRSLIRLDTGAELRYSLEELKVPDKLKGLKAFEFLQNIGVL